MAETTSGGVRINYEDVGSGEPAFLLMPAWCMSRSIYRHLMPLLSANRRTLALDWRGHGESETPADDFGSEQLVDDAIAVIEASGVQQVIPVSSSHAGWVALEIKKRLGDKVPKIVALDWLVFPPPSRS